MQLKRYSIWREGFSLRGNIIRAVKVGESLGVDFLTALINLDKQEPIGINTTGSPHILGANLYDNEDDARKKFG